MMCIMHHTQEQQKLQENRFLNVRTFELMAESDEAGVGVVKSVDSRQFFVLYHSEYDADTLKLEYERDLAKRYGPDYSGKLFPRR